jgi:hypothetical protein
MRVLSALILLLTSSLIACPDGTANLLSTSICAPGDRVCRVDAALVCSLDGSAWEVQPCVDDEVCSAGSCTGPGLEITTETIDSGEVASAYEAIFETLGGVEPLTWTAISGEIPPGLSLDEDGVLGGVPEVPGDYVIGAAVEDEEGTTDSRDFSLTIHPEPLEILTAANLGAVDEGVPMEVSFEAAGGVPPYGWFQLDGSLPVGVTVDAAGRLTGTPTEPGRFEFGLRVVDAEEPPGYAEADFSLDISLRPLVIVGDNSFTILGFSIVTLPLLTIIEGIPLPYTTQLEADGGLRPYAWTELQIPGVLGAFIPTGGIPANLVMDADGLITGSVTDTSQVVTLGIPFTGIELTGFFFFVQVADSQNPAETAEALFLIPTLPIAIP